MESYSECARHSFLMGLIFGQRGCSILQILNYSNEHNAPALRFVQLFDEDRIFDNGIGIYPFIEGFDKAHVDGLASPSTKSPPVARLNHCSHYGHPGCKKITTSLDAIIAWWIH